LAQFHTLVKEKPHVTAGEFNYLKAKLVKK